MKIRIEKMGTKLHELQTSMLLKNFSEYSPTLSQMWNTSNERGVDGFFYTVISIGIRRRIREIQNEQEAR